MELLDGSFLSQCSEFTQSIQQTGSNNLSSYSSATCAQPNSPIVQMDNPNLFSSVHIKSEPDTTSSYNALFPRDFTQQPSSSSSTPSGPNDLSLTKGHACEVCHKVFADRSLLSKHKIAHAEAKHICSTCGRAFVREDKLRRHIRSVHSSERPYVCDVCSKAFARKDKLQEHAKHHNKDITFPCPVCNEVFLMRSILNRHLRAEHNIRQTPDSVKSIPLKAGQQDNILQTPAATGNKRRRPKHQSLVDISKLSSDKSSTDAAAAAAAAAYYQNGGWNAANLLLYNRYQQQQQQQQQTQQQLDFWHGGNGYFYTSQNATAGYHFPTAQYAAAVRQHQQQQHPNAGTVYNAAAAAATPSAFSAAVAARLFSPANYWWPQAGQNFVFQQTAAAASQGLSTPSAPSIMPGVSPYFPTATTATAAALASNQSTAVSVTTDTAFASKQNASSPAHPTPFSTQYSPPSTTAAQYAAYYQAASLAASSAPANSPQSTASPGLSYSN